MIRLLFSFSFFTSLLCAATLVDGISFVVNDTPVTLYEVYKTAEERGVSKKEAMEYVIQDKLREIEAKKLEIYVSDIKVDEEISNIARQNGMSVYAFRRAVASQGGLRWSEYRERIRKGMLQRQLTQKIIAKKMDRPDENELQGYYESHKELFSIATTVKADKYVAASREDMQMVITNPLSSGVNVIREELTIDTEKYSPQLSRLLDSTQEGKFSPIIEVGGQFVSFYVRDKTDLKLLPYKEVQEKVKMSYFQTQEQKIISEYFERLRASVKVEIIRMPPEG